MFQVYINSLLLLSIVGDGNRVKDLLKKRDKAQCFCSDVHYRFRKIKISLNARHEVA